MPVDFAPVPAGLRDVAPGPSFRFHVLLGLVAALLLVTLGAAFALPSPWSWAVGIVYLSYETLLVGHLLRRSRRALAQPSSVAHAAAPSLGLAVLVAARNERAVLPACLAALRAQVGPDDLVVVVDDGSTDGTAAWCRDDLGLVPGPAPEGLPEGAGLLAGADWPALRVLRLARNLGKARALNAAMRCADRPVLLTLDADTLVEPGALAALRQAFAAAPALEVACEVVVPACAPGWWSGYFQAFQRLEYRRIYLWRAGWMGDRTLVLVPGAFAAFRRDSLVAVGGFDPASLTENYEVMFRLHRRALGRGAPLDAQVIPAARAATDAPHRVRGFLRQRSRWFAGFIHTMVQHRDLVGAPWAGRLGRVHLVLKTIDLLLPLYGLCAPLVLLGLVLAGQGLHVLILWILLGKALVDVALHLRAERLARAWLGGATTAWGRLGRVLLVLAEPVAFQPLRQFGAGLGWLAYLRGRIEWQAQRPAPSAPDSPPSPRLVPPPLPEQP